MKALALAISFAAIVSAPAFAGSVTIRFPVETWTFDSSGIATRDNGEKRRFTYHNHDTFCLVDDRGQQECYMFQGQMTEGSTERCFLTNRPNGDFDRYSDDYCTLVEDKDWEW